MNARVGHAGDMAYPSELCLTHDGNGVGDVCLLQNLFVKDLHHPGLFDTDWEAEVVTGR